MASLYQHGDCVCLELGADKRDVLFSIEIALWAAESLEDLAARAIVVPRTNLKPDDPTITVEAILNNRKAQVRLVFDGWATVFRFSPPAAVALAGALRDAARVAEKALVWKEERDPACLLR